MSLEYDATFDGTVFRPESQPDLEPNTRVRIVVKPLGEIKPLVIEKGEAYSFLDFAGSLKLEGPPDWSENINKHVTPADETSCASP